MSTPPLEGPDLKAARHLCHHYGVGGHTGGSFTTAFIRALEAADLANRERLLTAFPEYRRAVHILTTQGASALADTVKISARVTGEKPGTKGELHDGFLGPASRVSTLIFLKNKNGDAPDAIDILQDIRNTIDKAESHGWRPSDYVNAYLQQLIKHDLQEVK